MIKCVTRLQSNRSRKTVKVTALIRFLALSRKSRTTVRSEDLTVIISGIFISTLLLQFPASQCGRQLKGLDFASVTVIRIMCSQVRSTPTVGRLGCLLLDHVQYSDLHTIHV